MLAWACIASFLVQVIASPILRDDGTTVSTAQGAVSGTLVTPNVRQFLGIPFAASTAGSNRFQPPQAAPARTGTFNATSYGDSCPAVISDGFLSLIGILQQQEAVPVSEDCLNLNIWAPAVSRPQSTAVMIWVYGGSDQFGTSNTAFYNGQKFVENYVDLTIVTFNYRLDIFGFPSAPQLAGEAWNFGLLDLDAAVQWVYANIASFGGDPERITIFGESAGAFMVDSYAYSHPDDTIVKGIIAESGVALLLDVIGSRTSSSPWNKVADALGCGTTEDAAQFSCMQAVPWETLLAEVISSDETFGPSPDGYTVFSDTQMRSAEGQFLKAPFFVGNNADEGDVFMVELEDSDLGFTIPVATDTLADAITEMIFACPASQAANDRVSAGVRTYRYIYEGVFPDITDNNPNLRSFHTSEIPLVFGTYTQSTFDYPPTANEIALSTYIQGAWVAFARDPASGLTSYAWPQYSPLTSSIAELGNSANPIAAVFSPSIDFDPGCGVVNALTPLVIEVVGEVGGIL